MRPLDSLPFPLSEKVRVVRAVADIPPFTMLGVRVGPLESLLFPLSGLKELE